MNYVKSGDRSAKGIVTLNSLRDQQYSLNRQMLLAIQLCDREAQAAIKTQLAKLQEEIDRMTLRQ